jgi:hypothetical protein
MAQPNTPMLLTRKAQEALIQYHHQCCNLQAQNWNLRDYMRRQDLAYIREGDLSTENQRAKIANRYGDKSKFQNITVPVVMPMVESAVTYQSSVFLTGHPIFGVVSNPSNEDAAIQMETVVEEQSVRGGWVREIMMAFRDGFKYNIMCLEVNWDRVVTAALETDLSFSTTQARPKEVIWEGNCIRRRDMYNVIMDTRVPPTEMYWRGEFSGYTELMSRIQLKSFIQSLPDKMVDNIIPAFESGVGFSGITAAQSYGGYYVPQINPDAMIDSTRNARNSTNWLAWAGIVGGDNKIKYRDMYEITTIYAKILPSDFGMKVPAPNTPQVWKFVYVNHQILIYAERQTNAHGYLPMLFGQPLEDGLDYQTKSLSANVEPIQDLTSALWNSNIASRRRAISDRGIYDPSRITEAHINNDNPAAKIPVRPAAYGKPVNEAYYPIPYRDDQAGIVMQDTQALLQMANVIAGQNPVRQGQFVKGNKTLHEFQSVMSNANGRDQMTSMLLESQIFTPLKEIIKINILQYQGGISLFNRDLQRAVEIDPVALRKAVMDFKVSDGLTPSDKLINADTLQTAMQVIGSSPQIAAGYNLAPLFSYFIKTQGGRIQEFEKSPQQMAYEQAMMQWQHTMQMMAEGLKGMDPAAAQQMMAKMPPQPMPQQYGYNPQQQGGTAGAPPVSAPQVTNSIQNITRNTITQA